MHILTQKTRLLDLIRKLRTYRAALQQTEALPPALGFIAVPESAALSQTNRALAQLEPLGENLTLADVKAAAPDAVGWATLVCDECGETQPLWVLSIAQTQLCHACVLQAHKLLCQTAADHTQPTAPHGN